MAISCRRSIDVKSGKVMVPGTRHRVGVTTPWLPSESTFFLAAYLLRPSFNLQVYPNERG